MNEFPQYNEAITATTKGWTEEGIGFTTKDSAQSVLTLSRQLNTVLFSILKLREEVAELRQKVDRLSSSSLNTKAIEDLNRQLDQTHLSAKGVSFQQDKGKIKVYRNPFDLLKQIK